MAHKYCNFYTKHKMSNFYHSEKVKDFFLLFSDKIISKHVEVVFISAIHVE